MAGICISENLEFFGIWKVDLSWKNIRLFSYVIIIIIIIFKM